MCATAFTDSRYHVYAHTIIVLHTRCVLGVDDWHLANLLIFHAHTSRAREILVAGVLEPEDAKPKEIEEYARVEVREVDGLPSLPAGDFHTNWMR